MSSIDVLGSNQSPQPRRPRCWLGGVSCRSPWLSWVDYEAVGRSSVVSRFFQLMAHVFCSRQQRRWLRGVQGAGNESPGRRHDAGEILARKPASRVVLLNALGLRSTIRVSACAAGRPSHLVRRVAHSFWPSCLSREAVCWQTNAVHDAGGFSGRERWPLSLPTGAYPSPHCRRIRVTVSLPTSRGEQVPAASHFSTCGVSLLHAAV
jgi:hypothetical protein